jgi:RND family efflux transporter MFP subunit
MFRMAPTAARTKPEVTRTQVQVVLVRAQTKPARVRATGTITPAREIAVIPEVGGKVAWCSPELVPGGQFDEGDVLVRIDPRDYQLAVDQELGRVTNAELELEQELGRQQIAEREWDYLKSDETGARKSLVLRQPHLAAAKQNLSAAKSAVARARLELSRTTLTVPFNATVVSEQVDVGQVIAPGTRIASLVGTDQFWVRVSVPVERLDSLALPRAASKGKPEQGGSPARVRHALPDGRAIEREGSVLRVESQHDAATRTAQVLIGIDDPLDTPDGGVPLLPGAFVEVEISGTNQEHVFVLPRAAVHQGDTVWVVESDSTLGVRKVRITWTGADEVYAKGGLSDGERVIVTPLPTAILGMPVEVIAAPGAEPAPSAARAGD